MSKGETHIALEAEIKILQSNVKELQKQLADAHKRIGELTPRKDATEEVMNQQQLLQELKFEVAAMQEKLDNKNQELIDNIPNVMDSKQVLKEGN
tara:strand:+ start:1218 stop:1502 length:285 start_codon:yes stop_codon:yes gene_type:complete